MDTAAKDKRYIIRARSPEYYEAIKRLYGYGMSRAQVHRILEITKGQPMGVKAARHADSNKIWFTFQGHRYDLKPDGTVTADTKIAGPPHVPVRVEKKVKCQLCGTETPMVRYDVEAKCPVCGFRLVKTVVVQRRR